jgi:hypothetical protein
MRPFETHVRKALGLSHEWTSNLANCTCSYSEKCIDAALDAGLGPFVAECQKLGIPVRIEQTGGYTMVAYVDTLSASPTTRFSYGIVNASVGEPPVESYVIMLYEQHLDGSGEHDAIMLSRASAKEAAMYLKNALAQDRDKQD